MVSLVANRRAKYGIQDCDFYNFDETGFAIGMHPRTNGYYVVQIESASQRLSTLAIENGQQQSAA